MVVFSCSECGESMKKNQVEKHCTQICRNCRFLSCVDCGKEFWGYDYETHTKCMSEEEKTHGSLFKKDPSANKGEKKQENWVQQVHAAISKVKGNPALTRLLEKLKGYPNIPRKKAKFENFVKNSLRVTDCKLLTKAWDAISNELEVHKTSETQKENSTSQENQILKNNLDMSNQDQKSDVNAKKSSKKRKNDSDQVQPDSKMIKSDKEFSKEKQPNEEPQLSGNDEQNAKQKAGSQEEVIESKAAPQIKWKKSIINTLREAPGNSLKTKKLKKMVIAKLAQSADLTKEDMKKIFDDKLKKCTRVNITDDVVTLKE